MSRPQIAGAVINATRIAFRLYALPAETNGPAMSGIGHGIDLSTNPANLIRYALAAWHQEQANLCDFLVGASFDDRISVDAFGVTSVSDLIAAYHPEERPGWLKSWWLQFSSSFNWLPPMKRISTPNESMARLLEATEAHHLVTPVHQDFHRSPLQLLFLILCILALSPFLILILRFVYVVFSGLTTVLESVASLVGFISTASNFGSQLLVYTTRLPALSQELACLGWSQTKIFGEAFVHYALTSATYLPIVASYLQNSTSYQWSRIVGLADSLGVSAVSYSKQWNVSTWGSSAVEIFAASTHSLNEKLSCWAEETETTKNKSPGTLSLHPIWSKLCWGPTLSRWQTTFMESGTETMQYSLNLAQQLKTWGVGSLTTMERVAFQKSLAALDATIQMLPQHLPTKSQIQQKVQDAKHYVNDLMGSTPSAAPAVTTVMAIPIFAVKATQSLGQALYEIWNGEPICLADELYLPEVLQTTPATYNAEILRAHARDQAHQTVELINQKVIDIATPVVEKLSSSITPSLMVPTVRTLSGLLERFSNVSGLMATSIKSSNWFKWVQNQAERAMGLSSKEKPPGIFQACLARLWSTRSLMLPLSTLLLLFLAYWLPIHSQQLKQIFAEFLRKSLQILQRLAQLIGRNKLRAILSFAAMICSGLWTLQLLQSFQ